MKKEGQISVNSKNIFPIIKKWLYSDKDIFLREIVSNGCDAIKKYERLLGINEAQEDDFKPKLTVIVDKDAKRLIVEDNGIGMTADEVERYITQIAFSGAEDFVEKYKDKVEGDAGIIGHFGLGFYSAFMVSSTVEIDTLSYQPGATPVHWVSEGEETYELTDGYRTTHGSTITMNLADDELEFLEETRIREILSKYCAFMPYEIYLNPKAEERNVYDNEGKQEKNEDGTDKKEIVQPRPINDTSPLWLKAPKDCTDEEYKDFYRKVFYDFNEPLFWIHLNVDYPFNLKGILYFPKQTNKLEVVPGQVKLFCNQVFVADNIKEIIPEFLLLLKGVIDCPDMPLNVSRSFLQNDGEVQKIAQHITKKVSDKLHQVFSNDRESYEKYWNDISSFIKFGCIKDEKFYDRIKDILLLKTIDNTYKTLEEFPKEDKKIYYVTDENLQAQYIKMFREGGLTAALLTHVIDTHFISFMEYKEHESFQFLRIDSDIGDALKVEQSEDSKKSEEETNKPLISAFKEAIGKEKLTVQAQSLKSENTPAVILLSEYARRVQDMSRMYGEDIQGVEPEITIVLNTENPVVKKITELEGENQNLVCHQIYDLAMLSHKQLSADEMSEFVERSIQLLQKVMN